MTRRVLDLREEDVGRFPRTMLLETLALNASPRFEIEPPSPFNSQTYGLRSRGWVGQIPIGDDLLVRIAPKVPVSNLFRMLEVAYNLKSFQLFDGEIHMEGIEDIYERIVAILARRVLDRVRRGLYRSYVAEADELAYLRGRMDVINTSLNGFRGVPRISCRYEEHTEDLQENRILLWTLHQVPRQGIRREKVRIDLDHARRALAGTITLEHCSPNECIKRIYNRLNDDYSPMHGLCRFILEHTGPSIESGERVFIPFALNMPLLFQPFVAEWLRANVMPGLTVRCQHNAQLDANFEMKINVDVVLYEAHSQRPIAVLDTNYKANEQPSEADIYQVAFYPRELEVDRAMLVYPSKSVGPFRMLHGGDILIESLAFDLEHSPDMAGAAFATELNARLIESGRPKRPDIATSQCDF